MIEISNLCKKYGKLMAVNNLNLQVKKGEMFGFLGHNGAGKSTTIRILTTLTRPTSGRVLVGGYDVSAQPDKVKTQFGIVQQHMSLDRDLTVRENLELHARLRHFSREQTRQAIDEALKFSGLSSRANSLIDTLSGGQKRRVQIARCLMHNPQLVFLDEPTVGLDAQTRRDLWDLIRRLNTMGITIFLTTHYIEEAESLCDRVGIVHHGQMIAVDTPEALRCSLGGYAVETNRDHCTEYDYFETDAQARDFAQSIGPNTGSILIRKTNLEDVFVELTGQKSSLGNGA